MFIKLQTPIGDQFINPAFITAVLPGTDQGGHAVLGVCGVFVVGIPQVIQVHTSPDQFVKAVADALTPPHGDGSQKGALRITR